MNKAAASETGSRLSDKIGQFASIPYSFIKQPKGLSIHARWLFVILRYYTNRKSGKAFPSYDRIQELTGMQRGTISKCIKQLVDSGWLEKKRRFGNSNLYTLNIPVPNKKVTPEDGNDVYDGEDNDFYEGADGPF